MDSGFLVPAAANCRPDRWHRKSVGAQLVDLESNRTLWIGIPGHGGSNRCVFVEANLLSTAGGSHVGRGSINTRNKNGRQPHQF